MKIAPWSTMAQNASMDVLKIRRNLERIEQLLRLQVTLSLRDDEETRNMAERVLVHLAKEASRLGD